MPHTTLNRAPSIAYRDGRRFIFHADPAKTPPNRLAELLHDVGAEVVRKLRGGDVLAYADEGALAALETDHPEVVAEPDREIELCEPIAF